MTACIMALATVTFTTSNQLEPAFAADTGNCKGVWTGPPEEVVSAATRQSLDLQAWPDGTMGVLPNADGTYRFFAIDALGGTGALRQRPTVTEGTLENPVRGGVNRHTVLNTGSEFTYIGGKEVYEDPATGTVIQLLHEERNLSVGSSFWSELHLGRVDESTNTVTDLGAIIRPQVTYEEADAAGRGHPIGGSLGTIVNVGGVDYFYLHYIDLLWVSGQIRRTSSSVARAPVSAVISAAQAGQVTAWSKYLNGAWTAPGLGGASTDIDVGRPTQHPNVARSDMLNAYLLVTPQQNAASVWEEMSIAASTNGIDWAPRVPLFRDPGHRNMYPTIVGTTGTHPDKPLRSFWLYYNHVVEGEGWATAKFLRRRVICTTGIAAEKVNFKRYFNGTDHWVSIVPPSAGYNLEGSAWYLQSTSQPGTRALYSCQVGGWDQFVATDPSCEGLDNAILNTEGWIYTSPPAAPNIALYRCRRSNNDRFVSQSSSCEGHTNELLLGYALT
ncbi:hypothetical protein E1218_12205 [Kribbella turkmenica]|uniref:DUF4185 domain-containing protein n=1 Tax=Kribbella turkmenica TaxID=2530375 RepID=A0A4R4X8M4_9ACTN|nr:hypothetical protein [Kribbella turkmenica]TDD26814.1 hypothetical protein E1218_12205 [Kribbella turkmenica]